MKKKIETQWKINSYNQPRITRTNSKPNRLFYSSLSNTLKSVRTNVKFYSTPSTHTVFRNGPFHSTSRAPSHTGQMPATPSGRITNRTPQRQKSELDRRPPKLFSLLTNPSIVFLFIFWKKDGLGDLGNELNEAICNLNPCLTQWLGWEGMCVLIL